jgi:hypothetical protein
MTALDWYGLGALGLIGLVFCCVRRVPAYLALNAAVIALFASATFGSNRERLLTWAVMTTGLAACSFGLLIVRVMLVRSVSLQLLNRIEGTGTDVFDDDIRGRLNDMTSFHLVRHIEEDITLTTFGRFVSDIVAASYALFRIRV